MFLNLGARKEVYVLSVFKPLVDHHHAVDALKIQVKYQKGFIFGAPGALGEKFNLSLKDFF
jgi:hypothetical protein